MGTPKPPPEDLNDLPPKWLIALGSAVQELIQHFHAMPRFHEMVKEWVAQHEAEEARRAEWEERRRRHFMPGVMRCPRLRNRANGPPERDWVFETYSVPRLRAKDSDGFVRPEHITGWVPPELSYTFQPPVRAMLPLKDDWPLSLVEKYTLLAAIHDYACAGEEKIDPWHKLTCRPPPGQAPVSDRPPPFAKWRSAMSKSLCLRGCLSLRKGLPAVAEKQESVLRGFLAAVEKDLLEWARKKGATIRPPLTEKAAAVLKLLRDLPAERGLTGPEILDKLNQQKPPICFDQSTLTRYIIPVLKKHYGVRNTPRAGYHLPKNP